MIASDLWEGLFINVQHEHLQHDITLGNIYRPPKKNDNNDVIQLFNAELRPIIDLFGKENKNCIITGDTNINLLKINERIKFQEYFDIFVSNGLFPKITYPTRFSKSEKRCTGTLIDHLFCKYLDGENCLSSGIFISSVSDHLLILLILILRKSQQFKSKYIKVYKNKENAMFNFQRCL